MQRKCIKSKRQSNKENQGADKAPSLKMTLAKITKVKRTIIDNNHRENISNLPVKQQCQLQRNSFMVTVNKQRRSTQALAWGVEIQGTNQASHALQQNIHAKLAVRLATSLPDASQNLKQLIKYLKKRNWHASIPGKMIQATSFARYMTKRQSPNICMPTYHLYNSATTDVAHI